MFTRRKMTEADWLAGDDPGELTEAALALGWLSPRKLRLFIANAKATEPDDSERVDEVFGPAPYDWEISE